MSLDQTEQAADFIGLAEPRMAGTPATRDRDFWAALAFVILVHAVLIIAVVRHQPRIIGDANAREDAIAVSFMTEAEFLEQTSPSSIAGSKPEQQAQPAPPPPLLDLKPTEPIEEKPAAAPEPIEKTTPELFTLEAPDATPKDVRPTPRKPEPKSQEAKPQEKKPQEKKFSKLDLTPQFSPSLSPSAASGGPAGLVRPPGITRSGANDEFARGIIKALRQTMPSHRGVFGRVTVRIFLNNNGDVKNVEVVSGAADPSIDQEVVFAARQTTYPFPPAGAAPADLQFMITYIYN